MPYSQRDIVLVDFPFTDLVGSKLRPALIISTTLVNHSGDFICIQITSKEFDDGMFVPIQDDFLTTPLKLKRGIRMNKVFTVNKTRVIKKISTLKPLAFQLLEEFFQKIVF